MENLYGVHENAKDILEYCKANLDHVLTDEEEQILGEAVLYVEAEIRHYNKRYDEGAKRIKDARKTIAETEDHLQEDFAQHRKIMERLGSETDGLYFEGELARRQLFEQHMYDVIDEESMAMYDSMREIDELIPILEELQDNAAEIYIIMKLDTNELLQNVVPRDEEVERQEEEAYTRAAFLEAERLDMEQGQPGWGDLYD